MPISHLLDLDMKPFPWAAPRVTRKGAFNPKASNKMCLRWLIRDQWRGEPITGPVELCLYFAFRPSKNQSKSKFNDKIQGSVKNTVKPDLSNLIKSTEDCLKGIVIRDDNQVFKISAAKYWAETDHIKIIIVDHSDSNNKPGEKDASCERKKPKSHSPKH